MSVLMRIFATWCLVGAIGAEVSHQLLLAAFNGTIAAIAWHYADLEAKELL